MTETSTCNSLVCRTTVEGSVANCPKCGSRMTTPKRARLLGWVLLLLGLFLTGFIGFITWNMAPTLLHPGEEVAGGGQFTGTPEFATAIFRLLGTVIAFGVVTAVNGAIQIRTGKRNLIGTVGMLALFALLAYFAYAMQSSAPTA